MIKEKRQLEILKNDPIMTPLMFTMFYSAEVRRSQEKYDMATLLLYRLLEMMEQKRLARYELYISAMDYHNMVIPVRQAPETRGMDGVQKLEWLKYTVNGMKKELFGRIVSGYLPDQVSLLEGFIILQALGDPIMCRSEKGSNCHPIMCRSEHGSNYHCQSQEKNSFIVILHFPDETAGRLRIRSMY